MASSSIQAPNLQANPSVSIKAVDVASQLDLSNMSLSAPVYKYRRFYQVSGGASLALSTSNTLSQFVIPGSSVWNLSRSYLTVDVSATAAALATLFVDTLPIDSIQLQTDSGTVIANLQNVQSYLKAAQWVSTDMKEYLSRGPVFCSGAIGAVYPISVCYGCNPSNIDAGAARTSVEIVASLPTDAAQTDRVDADETKAVASSTLPVAASGSDRTGVGSPQQLVSTATGAAGSVRFRVNLKALLGTIFAVDKDMYFGQNLQLQIYWKPLDNFGFGSIIADTQNASLTALTATNYYLYMAEDINEDVVLPLKQQIRSSGASILIPYTVSTQYTTAAAASLQTATLPLTPGTGIKLKRIISVPVSSESKKFTSNTFNVANVKYSALQSFIDSKPLQDMQLQVANSDLYNYLYELCKNSPSFMSPRTYEQNMFWIDNFSDCDDSCKFRENDCKVSGLDVQQAKTYALALQQTRTGGSLTICQYQTWIRNLVIRPDGLSWG